MCTADDDWEQEAKRAEGDEIHDGSFMLQFIEEYIPTPTGLVDNFYESNKLIPKTAHEYIIWAHKYKSIPIVSEYIPKVIEFGTNIGKWLPTWDARRFDIHGIDMCPYAIEVIKRRYPHLANQVYLGKIWDFDKDERFKDQFDLVYTVAVIQHNNHEQKRRILETVKWFLKPNGYYLMVENTRPEEDYDDGYSFDYPGWIRFFEQSGMELVKYTNKPAHIYLWRMKNE